MADSVKIHFYWMIIGQYIGAFIMYNATLISSKCSFSTCFGPLNTDGHGFLVTCLLIEVNRAKIAMPKEVKSVGPIYFALEI